ncbi:MAG: ActD-like protein, partial [Spirochaetes bacterium]|nr:ActD-like protein [Spirochaetota bacterium]
LEQYALGELPSEEEARVRTALARDGGLRDRLDALRESDRRILAAYPVEDMAAAIRGKLRAEPSTARGFARERAIRRFPPLAFALPVAASILLFLSFLVARERILPSYASTGAEVTRLKGVKTHLTVYRKAADGAEEISDGETARPRDVLQISYTAAEAKYGVILSVDGRGTVTWHLPGRYAGTALAAPSLSQQGEVILPSAYELDDAPSFERFILVYSAAPFDVRAVEQAAQALASRPKTAASGSLALSPVMKQVSVVLKKQR